MNEPNPIPPIVEFKDRRTGLIVFGVLTLLLGGLCALFVPLMLFGQAMNTKATSVPANFQGLIIIIATYGLLAVALIWLGIGSIQARRWARALLLIFSWSALLIGVVAMVGMGVLLPHITAAIQAAQPAGKPPLPEAAKMMMVIISTVTIGVIYLVLPTVWILFYRSPHVKATCEARDPVPRWTDACPLPVLAVCLWLAPGAVMLLLMPLAYRGVLPFFGTFLSGLPGTLGYFAMAGLWAWSAQALYRLDVRGWWVVVVALGAWFISNALTYSRHDVMEMYSLMGFPEPEIEQLRKMNFLSSNLMTWGSLIFMVPLLGYLIYVKRFFRRSA